VNQVVGERPAAIFAQRSKDGLSNAIKARQELVRLPPDLRSGIPGSDPSALSLNKPVLGVCLGSQLLAHVLGAKVYAGPAQGGSAGTPVTISSDAATDALWSDVPSTFTAYHWHGDVFDLPANCELLASSALTPHQAFRYGAKRLRRLIFTWK